MSCIGVMSKRPDPDEEGCACLDIVNEATIDCMKTAVAMYAGNIIGVTIDTVLTTCCVYEAGVAPASDVR